MTFSLWTRVTMILELIACAYDDNKYFFVSSYSMKCMPLIVVGFVLLVVLLFTYAVETFKSKVPIFHTNIEQDTIQNQNYRKILYTNHYQQVGLMTLLPGEDIPKEIHSGDQFFRIEKGDGIAVVGDNPPIKLTDGSALIIPANTPHYICLLYTSDAADE